MWQCLQAAYNFITVALHASAFVTVFNILLWTVGFGMITGTVEPKEVVRTVCTNPVLIAVAIGLVIYLCQICLLYTSPSPRD